MTSKQSTEATKTATEVEPNRSRESIPIAGADVEVVGRVEEGALSSYSDAELDQLFENIRRLDEDGFVGAAHSAAVKD